MIGTARILFGLSVLLGLAFIVALGRPWRHRDRDMAWFLASAAWVALLIDCLWFAAVLGLAVGTWAVYLLMALLAVQDAVLAWRLWLVLRSKRRS